MNNTELPTRAKYRTEEPSLASFSAWNDGRIQKKDTLEHIKYQLIDGK